MNKANISSLGTIAAALLAKLCCIGPAVFIVSGTSLGFMGGLSFLSPYKNYLLGAAVIMLGYSFRRIYLKKTDCACRENIRSRKIERGIFWLGVAALVFTATFSKILLWIYG